MLLGGPPAALPSYIDARTAEARREVKTAAAWVTRAAGEKVCTYWHLAFSISIAASQPPAYFGPLFPTER